MALGKRLKQLLDERNITVKDFAKSIGVAPTTLYSFIKRDSSTGKLDLIGKISKGLGMQVEEFLSDESSLKEFNMPMITLDDTDNINWTKIAKSIKQASGTNERTDKEIVNTIAEIIEPVVVIKNNEPTTLAAHFSGDEYTDEELDEIRQFAEFVKSKRK